MRADESRSLTASVEVSYLLQLRWFLYKQMYTIGAYMRTVAGAGDYIGESKGFFPRAISRLGRHMHRRID